MPTMAEYRLGARPRWRSLHEATFVRTSYEATFVARREPALRLREAPALAIDAWLPRGVGSPARGTPGGAAAAPARSSGLGLRRSPLTSWQSGNHSLGAHGPAARSLGARPPNPGQGHCCPSGSASTPPSPSCSRATPEACSRSPWDFTPESRRSWHGAFTSALVTSGSASVLRRRSAGQYVPLLSPSSFRPGAPGRSSLGPASPRREETIPVGCLRVMQVAPLRDLSRRRSLSRPWGDSGGTARPSGRRSLSPSFAPSISAALARHPWIPTLAGWGTLVVEIGYAFLIWPRRTRRAWCHRDDRIAPGRRPVHGARLLFERDDSPDRLPLSDPRRSPGSPSSPGARRRMRTRRPVQAALLVSLCLLPFGLGARRETGLPDDFAPLWSAVSWRVTRSRAWPWESSRGDASSSLAASVTAMSTGVCR